MYRHKDSGFVLFIGMRFGSRDVVRQLAACLYKIECIASLVRVKCMVWHVRFILEVKLTKYRVERRKTISLPS
jgi:hypothetical protein